MTKSDNSRSQILANIRQHDVPAVELPELIHNWIQYESPVDQFVEVLSSVGGRITRVEQRSEVDSALAAIPEFANAKVRCSTVADLGQPTFELNLVEDPHDLEDIDFALLEGEFGVAENGAVWLTDRNVRHRAVFFIAQHLGLVVSASQMVSNMHQAYERISLAPAFGLFMSGPSKTADIEQSLVIGAHGARSLTLFLLP